MSVIHGTKTGGPATADSTGAVTWCYQISKKDPKGTWSAVAQASYNSRTATSNVVTFKVQ